MIQTAKIYTDAELRYSAYNRCSCGAGLAYPAFEETRPTAWDCADILTGRAVPDGQEGAAQHIDRLPFAFYEVKSEDQPSANGATTRRAPLAERELIVHDHLRAVWRRNGASMAVANAEKKLAAARAEYDDRARELADAEARL